ncbi:MAG: hypothetical protein J7K87_03725 [Candidatus Aenigmarchaeota archaeon]|nr:hypothetical protein [Candidatus Aenigmarchaeota archaeon]
MNMRKVYDYYSNEEVLNKMVANCKGREISASLYTGSFISRPNVVVYPRDILEMVKRGAVSFHGSVEHWMNPMQLSTRLTQDEMNGLRMGWDLIIDIDSAIGLEASKLAAKRVIDSLKRHGVKHPGLKFSGNRGFHIGVPWSAFPKMIDYEETKKQFPKIPQIIAAFIRNEIKDDLLQDLIRMKGSLRKLVEDLGQQIEEITPYIFVEVEKDWGPRHLFRLPYSLNEKSWLVSIPIKDLDDFKREDAEIERVKPKLDFFQRVEPQEATELVVDALDWHSSQKRTETKKKEKKTMRFKKKVSESQFPPCIKAILQGLPDGRKRSLFILVNFLTTMGWSWDEVKKKIIEWNKKNKPPLRDNYISTQLKWFERQGRNLLPPNCDNQQFYKSIGVCKPDSKCEKIKNPVVYPFKK